MKMESTSSSNMSDGPPWLRKYTGALFGNDIFGNKILDSGGAEFSAFPARDHALRIGPPPPQTELPRPMMQYQLTSQTG